MKKKTLTAGTWLLAIATAMSLNSCLKDTGTQRYKVYTPVYTLTSTIRSAIKNDNPQPIVSPGKICIQGNIIFLNEKEKGIHVIDNSNPSSPVNKAFISIPGNEDIAVKGNILYADCYTDLMAIDITNPNAIVLKNFVPNVFPDRSYVNGFYVDTGKIISSWNIRDTVLNVQVQEGQGIWRNGSYISNGLVPGVAFSQSSGTSSSNTVGVGGSMAKIALINNYLYAVSADLLSTINVSDPASPGFLKSTNIHMGIGSAETIFPFNDQLFIGSMSGMYIFSVADPQNPQLVTTFTHATVCDPVITDGTYAYITLQSGTYCSGVTNELDVVNIQNETSPVLVKTYPMNHPNGLSKDNNILMVCDEGLKIYDAADPANLQLKQTIAMANPYDVICINGLAIVSANDGLYQFDYSNPSNVKQLSKLSLNQ